MLTFNNKIVDEFKKIVDERVNKLKDDMSVGHLSLEAYKLSAGHIRGLIEASSLIDEAISICEGR